MPLHPEARADAPFYVVLNAGSGSAEADVRSATIRDVLGGGGRAGAPDGVAAPARQEAAARPRADPGAAP